MTDTPHDPHAPAPLCPSTPLTFDNLITIREVYFGTSDPTSIAIASTIDHYILSVVKTLPQA